MGYKNSRSNWGSVMQVLSRRVDRHSPYQRLALAVIGQALSDLAHHDPDVHESARRSVNAGHLRWWCDQIDIDHDYLLRLIDDAGLMPRSQQMGVSYAA